MEEKRELLERYKIPLGLCLVGFVLLVGGMFANSKPATKEYPKESIVQDQKIKVDVSGAVVNPGVYELNEAAIVEEGILAAGGLKEEANTKFISKYINMAKKLSDGSKLYIPAVGEKDTDIAVAEVAGVNVQEVDLNSASQKELEDLPGIGPVSASKIISGRPYQKIEELLDKKIVGKAVFEKIKAQIIVN